MALLIWILSGTAAVLVIGLTVAGRRSTKEIPTAKLDDLDWSAGVREQSLNKIYERSRDDALSAIGWYVSARQPKKKISLGVRFAAILGLGTAAALPLINELLETPTPGIWVSIAVAFAGGAVFFDRFYGSSSGWIRYIRSEQQLRALLKEFEFDWETQRASWIGAPPTTEAVTTMLGRVKAFTADVNVIVRDETNAWVEEFQSSLKQIDQAADAQAAATAPGAVNILVTNGDQCDAGWTLSAGPGMEVKGRGKRTAITLPPGTRILRVEGMLRGQSALSHDHKAIQVAAGSINDAELTLS